MVVLCLALLVGFVYCSRGVPTLTGGSLYHCTVPFSGSPSLSCMIPQLKSTPDARAEETAYHF